MTSEIFVYLDIHLVYIEIYDYKVFIQGFRFPDASVFCSPPRCTPGFRGSVYTIVPGPDRLPWRGPALTAYTTAYTALPGPLRHGPAWPSLTPYAPCPDPHGTAAHMARLTPSHYRALNQETQGGVIRGQGGDLQRAAGATLTISVGGNGLAWLRLGMGLWAPTFYYRAGLARRICNKIPLHDVLPLKREALIRGSLSHSIWLLVRTV
jgi:hypothetical protein